MNSKVISDIKLEAISIYLPKKIVTNKSNRYFNNIEIDKISKTTGIYTRREVSPKESTDDMLLLASKDLINKFNVNLDEVCCVVSISQTPKNQIPGISYYLGNKLGLNQNCVTFDINLGCSGFTHGVFLISQLLSNLNGKKALLVMGDSLSRFIDNKDKGTAFIFGDGAAAILLSKSEGNKSFFKWKSIFNDYDKIIIKKSLDEKKRNFLEMNGMDVFSFAIKEVPNLINETLKLANMTQNEVDYFVLHQANEMVLKYIEKKLSIDPKKNIIKLNSIGNTSAASIPIALVLSILEKSDKDESFKKLCFCGFGVGLSLSCTIMNISNLKCSISYGGENE